MAGLELETVEFSRVEAAPVVGRRDYNGCLLVTERFHSFQGLRVLGHIDDLVLDPQ